MDPAHQHIGGWVGGLAAAFRRGLDLELAPYGVTASQWPILKLCYSGKFDTPSDLVRVLPVDAPAVTRLLDRLEAKGLICREPNPNDRRSVRVELTKRGRALVPKLRPLIEKNNSKFLQGLSKTELSLISSLFPKLLRNAAIAEDSSS